MIAKVQNIKYQPGSNGTTVAFTLGDTPAPGNILIAFVGYSAFSGDRTITPPSGGWTEIDKTTSGNAALAVYWYEVQEGDGTSFTFTVSGSSDTHSGVLYELSGVDVNDPIDGHSITTTGSQMTITTTGLTPSVLGTLALTSAATDTASSGGLTLNSVSSGFTIDQSAIPVFHSTFGVSKDDLTSDIVTEISNLFTFSTNSGGAVASLLLLKPEIVSFDGTETIDLTENLLFAIDTSLSENIDLIDEVISRIALSQSDTETIDLTDETIVQANINIEETIDLTENITPNIPQENVSIEEIIDLTESISANIPETASFAVKIVSVNPLIFITAESPAKIVKVDTTDPLNPVHDAEPITGITSATDVAINTTTNFIYVAGNTGQIVKIDLDDITDQTIFDVSDSDNFDTVETMSQWGLTYGSTDASTGELYLLDERTTFEMDTDFRCLHPVTVIMDTDFALSESVKMDTDLRVIAESTVKIDTNFVCLTNVIDNIEPLKRTDFQVFVDSVELVSTDLVLRSIVVEKTVDARERATFLLTRKHDSLNINQDGDTVTITNQNAVEIKLNSTSIFTGKISNLTPSYGLNTEQVQVEALTDNIASYKFNDLILSLPSLGERLNPYHVKINNPVIYNPYLDLANANPEAFKGIKAPLGTKIRQSVSRYTDFDSTGSDADKIQAGTFNPKQNWTYFWSPTASKFGDFTLGQTTSITALYIGTSLSPISEGLWNLTNARRRRQRIYPDITSRVGTTGIITVGELEALNLSVTGSTLFSALQGAGYINGSGVIQSSFINSIFTFDDLDIDYGDNIKAPVYELLDQSVGYYVGSAPFQAINPRNGILETKFKWKDKNDGLYSIKDASYNFENYVKDVADLELQKLQNINGNVFPQTSCQLELMVDAYLFYDFNLLTRINLDNTTVSNTYKNSNGFPVAIKSITISADTMTVSLNCDNKKSNIELRTIDGLFPDENDPRFNEDEKSIFIAQKSDLRTRLSIS